MNNQDTLRQSIRSWVEATSDSLGPGQLADDQPIFGHGGLTSLHVMDLLLLIEALSGQEIDVEQLEIGALRSLDAIIENFFSEAEGYCVN